MNHATRFARLVLLLALVGALALAGCGGSDSGSPTMPMTETPPTPYEMAVTNIAAADTANAAQAAYDAVKGDVTAAEGDKLQAAVDDRIAALDMMGRAADQKMALMTAAGNVDTSDLMTAEDIDAANTAIYALKTALAAAVDVSDADKAMYQATVDVAGTAVMTAQSALDHTAQTMALSGAVDALRAIDLGDLSTEEAIDAANDAIVALRTALDNATELTDAEKAVAMAELATANRTVMAAQGRVDIAGQKMMLSDAVKALEAIDLDALMTQEDIGAAHKAIITLELALKAATGLTDAEKLDATVDVTLAKRRVTAAETALATNIEGQTDALTMAATALGEIDLDDLDTPEKVTAANEAVEALKMALEGATHLSKADKATYQTQLEMATETVKTAQTGMDLTGRMAAQRTALTNAVTMATTAVVGVDNDSTDSEVAAADSAIAALQTAIDDAEDLSAGDADVAIAQGTLTTLTGVLAAAKTSRMAAIDKKDTADMKAMAATGKAMHAALAGPTPATDDALENIATGSTLLSTDAATLGIDAADGAGSLTGTTSNPDAVTLKAGDSAGALGSWDGMDYSHTNTGTKVVNEARVYTNKGPGKSESFADAEYTIATATDIDSDAIKGYVFLVDGGDAENGIDVMDVRGDDFAHSGTQIYTYDAVTDAAFTTRGTFDGAPGVFRCTGTCSVTNDGKDGPSDLGGDWHFKPDAGANAMVRQPDDAYLYYGWWVSKDKDGMPTAASAFVGKMGVFNPDAQESPGEIPLSGIDAIPGSATYTGHAAGKFAMRNPLDGTGDGGHFTADATLNAKFSGDGAGISGTLDNFMANDESVPWSVSLNNTSTSGRDADNDVSSMTNITDAGAFATSENRVDTAVDESKSTVWSINGNAAPASGTWSGQMYDELPGNAPGGDGSNIPTTVTGTFYSEFSTIGRMVGGFGADKQ